ncbi:hypothetical protein CTAYLR_001400 [Chrysophaeum taylorii]|uniref:Uncharacterized protein n=1 Tax=Chrysophaeum taylorii TaxID=2483200 RepID=A0AAD7XJF1_9STRA|nr:hypothetical protein CTAYLR_001400 [Chrysophaeum taylorii]
MATTDSSSSSTFSGDSWPELAGCSEATATLKCQGGRRPCLDVRLAGLTGLRFLEVRKAQLERLDESQCLQRLRDLSLADNALGPVVKPETAFLGCGQLRSLDLSGNGLESLPKSLPESLETLNVSRNRLEALDASETQIRRLIASDNRIENVSGGARRLQELCLRRNALSTLARFACPELRDLDVADNRLVEVDLLLERCPKIARIDLSGNPLVDKKLARAAADGSSKKLFDALRKGSGERRVVVASKEALAIRPHVVACVLRVSSPYVFAPDADDDFEALVGLEDLQIDHNEDLAAARKTFDEFLASQTRLHAKGRRRAAIGTHALEAIAWPLAYVAADDVDFLPIAGGWMREKGRVSARKFAADLAAGKNSSLKHAAKQLLAAPKLAHLVDARGTVLSVPPLSNAYDTRITLDTKSGVFLEVSAAEAKDDSHVRAAALHLLNDAIALFEQQAPGRTVMVEPVDVVYDFDRTLLRSSFPDRDELLSLPPLPDLPHPQD